MGIINELKELAKVPPTEIYLKSELVLVKQNLKNLMKVVEASTLLIDTVNSVYSGTPGKLEWPGYHLLRQALKELDGDK